MSTTTPLGHRVRQITSNTAMGLYLTVTIFPFIFMVVTALKEKGVSRDPFVAFKPTLKNFSDILQGNNGLSQGFSSLLMHSLIVTLLSTLLVIVIAVPAAYGLARPSFGASERISNWVLSTYMFPPTVAVIPVYLMVSKLNLIDKPIALIVPYAAFNMPIAIWILRSSILQIPHEIMEASRVDGANTKTELTKIVVPLLKPSIMTVAIISAILSWNEFLFALALTRDAMRTAPVGIQSFSGMYGTEWGPLMAASFVIIAPLLIATLFLRRHIVSGLTFGAVK